ncbi:hypothetical protein NQ314_020890 [Rhamnusium bicolor]|uniref:YqaJ viral recombinase domain-containing protein n=1 Tax=Rhamnusium bicolor TaxID=1586634 RepID=A0AAV8WKG2_9CUCU|nr:hypothetical protein NQ314_020890 [Rhamnusium bicolor]
MDLEHKKSKKYLTFTDNFATSWGKDHAPIAINEFEKINNVKVQECGLFVDPLEPYLGASPDGLIEEDAIIEGKRPKNISSLTPLEGIKNRKIKFAKIENNKMKLNKNHNYYYQVQGQLHVTKRDYYIFIVWTNI